MKKQHGFTIVELVVVVVLLAFASILFFVQKGNVESAARDDHRKIAVNAMYYNLEEIFYEENGYYPRHLESDSLSGVDPDLFEDPQGYLVNQNVVTMELEGEEIEVPVDPDYRYEPVDCDGDECQGYELRAALENEDDFVRTNRERE